jgi:hypothetical protein
MNWLIKILQHEHYRPKIPVVWGVRNADALGLQIWTAAYNHSRQYL